MTWAEYWKAEGVMAAGDTTSSGTADSHDEKDKGAFDAVTRATVNHGLHRGSYQCTAIIEGEKGTYNILTGQMLILQSSLMEKKSPLLGAQSKPVMALKIL